MGSNGPAWGRRQLLRRETSEALAKAYAEVDQLECRAWNFQMADGGPSMPSPTIEQALNGGYPFLRVKCAGCRQVAWITLIDVDRPRDTPVWKLEGSLTCEPCKSRAARAPRAIIERLCRSKRQFGWDNL